MQQGGIAQRSEQAAHNCLVHGSNPCAPTLFRFEKRLLSLLFLARSRRELIRCSRWRRRFGYLAKLVFFSSSWRCWWSALSWHGLPRGARTNLPRSIPGVNSLRRRRARIEYVDRGEGPTLLVFHDAPGGYDQAMLLGSLFAEEEFHLVAPSRPGYLRTPLTTGQSLAEQADAMAALIETMGISQRGGAGEFVWGTGSDALRVALCG